MKYPKEKIKSKSDAERITALGSIYGIDIQLDNVKTSRHRMLSLIAEKVDWNAIPECVQILSRNIQQGDFFKYNLNK